MSLDEITDEAKRKLLKPSPSDEQVLAALQNFLQPGETMKIVKELDSYDDSNYLVERSDGVNFLCKVHNGVESDDFIKLWETDKSYFSCNNGSVIHMQDALMTHLNKNGITTSKPQNVVDEESEKSPVNLHSLPVVSAEHSPRLLAVRLLSWVPGRTMSSLPALPLQSLIDAGIFLGRMDQKLDLLNADDYPASKRYHAWDGKNTADLRQYLDCITDSRRRGQIAHILDTVQKELLDSGVANQFRTGFLQADFNDANILVDDKLKVTGVIDFGDSVSSWKVLDISVAMAYAMVSVYGKADQGISAAAAMLRGYHSVYPLQDLERKHLHLLVSCRLAASVTLGAYSFQQNPENKYLLLHSEPAWKSLETWWGFGEEQRTVLRDSIGQVFDRACDCSAKKDGSLVCSDLAFPDPYVVDMLPSLRETIDATAPSAKRRKTEISNGDKPVITFVTGNKKKLEEVRRILGTHGPFEITNHKVDLPELQGDPVDIAKEKCSEAAKQVGGAVITEDTSLCFAALHGLPGPYIKWFLDKCGLDGLNKMISSSDDKSAYAQTVVAFCPGPDKDVVVFDGRTMGKIVSARGQLDFGWDPVFQPDEGFGLTYAEMTKEAKDSISHRSRAFAQLRKYFAEETDKITSSLS